MRFSIFSLAHVAVLHCSPFVNVKGGFIINVNKQIKKSTSENMTFVLTCLRKLNSFKFTNFNEVSFQYTSFSKPVLWFRIPLSYLFQQSLSAAQIFEIYVHQYGQMYCLSLTTNCTGLPTTKQLLQTIL